LSILARLLGWLRPQAGRVVLSVLLMAGTLAAGVGLLATSAWLIATAAERPSIAALGVAVVGVRFFGLSRSVLRYLERLISHDATLGLLTSLRVTLLRGLVPLLPALRGRHRSGEVLSSLTSDVDTLQDFFLRVLGPGLAAILCTALVTLLLATRGTDLAAAGFLALCAAGLLAPCLAVRLGRGAGSVVVAQKGALSARLVDGVHGLSELLVLDRAKAHLAAVERESLALRSAQARLARAGALGGALAMLAADLGVLAVLTLAVSRVSTGTLSGVELAVVVLLTIAAFEAVASLPGALLALESSRAAAQRILALLDTPPPVADPVQAAAIGRVARIEIRGLSFTYPGEEAPALRDLDLVLEPGRLVALVGPSGSGKSTLVDLLLRFREVPRGSILLDGRAVEFHRADEVRGLFAVAHQRVHIFTGSIRDNLLLGSPTATDTEIEQALHAARLDAFVASLPQQIDTPLGVLGLRLSGGEAQRLALARAFLKAAPFLLLDEPTAHLDPELGLEILTAIKALRSSQGMLLATHRLTKLAGADEIVVLEQGQVIQRGAFPRLAAEPGRFRDLLRQERLSPLLGAEEPGSPQDEETPAPPFRLLP
jgi:thiol reductant ABC exporter CydC subunit